MTWKTPPKFKGEIDIAAAVQRANGKHPAPATKPQPNCTAQMESHMDNFDRHSARIRSLIIFATIAKLAILGALIWLAVYAINAFAS